MRRNRSVSQHIRRPLLAIAMASAVMATVLQGPASVYALTNPVRQPAARAAAPVKLPPPSGAPKSMQPRPLSVGEQPDLRTRFSSTRFNADHTFTTSASVRPVNYRSAGGRWQPIDNTLVSSKQSGYAYQNGANGFQAEFKSQLGDDYLRWVADGQAVSFSLQGASNARASVKGSTITYADALSHVDATYTVLGDGLEEVLALRDASARASFQFLLKTPRDTTASQQADGSWSFALPGRAPASFWLKAPYAYDSGPRSVDPGDPHTQMSVIPSKDGFQVILSIDGTWLRDPARRFPVFVDPTITVQPDTLDTTFAADCGTCAGFVDASGRMFIGTNASHTYREGLQFDLSAVPAGVSVTGASLGVFYDQACIAVSGQFCGGVSHQIDVHRMTGPWSTSTTSAGVQFDSSVLSSFTLPLNAGQEWMTWDVTGTASAWVSGSQPNYGLYLMLSSEKKGLSGPAPPGNTFQVGQLAPVLTVTYSGDAVSLAQPAALHANGAELSWSQYTGPSGAPFQRYQVHRSRTPNFTPSAATLLTSISDLATTTFRDTTAAPGGTFSYAVVANGSKSNEVKVTLPADGQSSVTLQPGPGQGKAGFVYLYDRFVNCANYGADQFLQAGADGTGVYRSLLQFDLPEIPSTATNVSAKLNLVHFLENNVNLTFHAYPVTSNWDEGTGTRSPAACTGNGATWYERTGGVQWNRAGGDFDTGTASSAVTIPANETENLDSFDVSGIVSRWVSGQAPNLGFLLKADTETRGTLSFAVFAGNDYSPAPGLRPQLQVTYTDGSHATPPTVSVVSPAPGSMVTGSSVTLSAAAAGDSPVSQVQFFVDGAPAGSATQTPWSVAWNSASVGNGAHTITAKATDSAGNTATSAALAVTVNNFPTPTTSITPPSGSLSGTVTVATTNTVASGLSVSKVELYADGALAATATAAPWSLSWNTLDPNLPAYDGSHTLTSRVYDSSGLVASSTPVAVAVGNAAGTPDQATFDPALVPQSMRFDPNASTQLAYPIDVGITNVSGTTWSAATTILRYRWYLAGSTTSFGDSADVAGLALAPGQKQTVRVNVSPPTLPAGMDAARFVLRFDLVDGSGSPAAFFADRGNLPLDNPVIVNKVLSTNLGLEHFWQYTSQPVGGGITHMANVANGNSLLVMRPFSEPGRGLSTEVQLTYNSLEEHSDSPLGNNWSLAITGLSRFGDPLDIHPNNADSIAGRSNKFISFVDGDGTIHTFTGVTGTDGTTFWQEPPGVHLYLRSVTTDTSNPKFWAVTRPDRLTFWYNHDGFPTYVTDRNGNALSFTLSAVQPGDDPGGPKFHVTQVTDAAGQGANPAPNRTFTITYFTKATARKPQIRGKVASISDHVGHQLTFSYYDDGNLLGITEQGGANADGSFLPSRTAIFTYTTSDGSGPAIANAGDRVNPDPKTPNESTKAFSVRDYDGHETTFTYDGPGTSQDRWKLASVTDRAGAVTSYTYDDVGLVTTVAEPTPSGQADRTYQYAYDVQGRPTQITDPLRQRTSLQWSVDDAVTRITAADNSTRQFTYNDNGYPTDIIDELGDHTVLTYENIAADGNDVPAHWNPAGGANGTGRTIPHLSQVATKQDPNAVQAGSPDKWRYTYDANGNLKQVFEPLFANPATNDYNPDGTLADTRDFLGNQTTYLSYDANGLPTRIADATDSPTAPTHPLQLGYDAAGRTVFTQDENHASFAGGTAANYQSQFLYDSFGRLGRQTTPKSTSLSLGTLVESDTRYDPNNNVLSVVAPHCVPRGACTNETASSDVGTGDTSTVSYDVMDRKVQETDPSGNRMAYAYDAAGRLSQVTLPLGVQNGTLNNTRTISSSYDALDRITVQSRNHVNPDNSVSALSTLACYDSVGNTISVTRPRAQLGSITCPGTTSTPFTTVYAYDAAHHPISVTDPLTGDGLHHTTSSTYDANGNRVTTTDANGNTTTFTFDALNRLTQTSTPFITGASPHPVVSRTVYDADGNVVQGLSPRAVDCSQVAACEPSGTQNYVTTNHYDQLNRLVRQDLPVDGTFPTQYYAHRAYDFNGNLLSTSLPTAQGDPTQVPAALKTTSVYFDTGWIATGQVGTDPRIHYDYNGKGQQTLRVPESKSGGLDLTNEVFWTYQPNGLLASRTDQQNQPVTYQYDADGNLTLAHDASGLVDSSQTPVDTQNTYDDLDRLVRSDLKKQTDANWSFSSFAYDLDGNVTDQDQNGLEQSPNGALVKDGHKINSDYDGAGWLTDQLDSTLNQRVLNSYTPIGLESRREIDKSNGSGGWTPLQTTTWDYFANGKLNHLTTVNGGGTTLESHTVSYLIGFPNSGGVYADGNRVQDVYSLRPGGSGSSSCYPGTCAATFSYDAQDRLVRSDDGHGGATTYTLDGPGNILTQTSGATTTSNTYTGNQLQQSVTGGQTLKYWYDDLGRQQCVTNAAGSQADCNPSENTTASTNLVNDNRYDYLDRLQTYRAFSAGTRTDEATYVYDAESRQVQESELHPSFNSDTHVTQFSYLGTSNLDVEEQQSSKSSGSVLSVKDFTYDVNGHRLAMTQTPYTNGQPGTPTTYTYGYDVHGSVSQLVDPDGNTKASYGYTPYGAADSQLTQGDTDKTTPLNPFRYSGKRMDTGSGTLDMGARRFGPDTAHFLTPDFFYGSLANLGLSTDPITGNRYDLAGGNPISFKEWDGHMVVADGGGGASTSPAPTAPPATQPSKNSDGGAPPAPMSCDWWNVKCQVQKHAQDLKKLSDISGAIAGVAGTVALGCAAFGAIASETVVGGIAGGACATVAGGIAAGASGVSFVSGALAKAGGANVSNTDLALSAVGAIPGVGALGRGARAVEDVEEGARAVSGVKSAAKDLAESCAVNSFRAGTLVLMADGSKKPIEQVKEGDEVEAGDPQSGIKKAEPVQRVIVGTGLKHLYDIEVAGGVIEATYNHPFWVIDKQDFEWAQDLQVGEHLLTPDGQAVPIVTISHRDEITSVFNLSIRAVHTYYVGDQSLLVHNSCSPDLDALAASAKRPIGTQGVTKAGQELEKHAGGLFPSGPLGSASAKSELGQFILEDILTNPGTTHTPVTSGNFAGGIRFIDPIGRGATFDANGLFQYFGEYP